MWSFIYTFICECNFFLLILIWILYFSLHFFLVCFLNTYKGITYQVPKVPYLHTAFLFCGNYVTHMLKSLSQPSEFWGEIAKSYLEWMEPFHTVSNCDLPNGKISWFEGGKLNASGKLCPVCCIYVGSCCYLTVWWILAFIHVVVLSFIHSFIHPLGLSVRVAQLGTSW